MNTPESEQTRILPQSLDEFKKEFKSQVYKIIATGLLGILVLLGGVVWRYGTDLPAKAGLVPEGAVVAFDLESGCPTGWDKHKKSLGRFLIGAFEKGEITKMSVKFSNDTNGNKINFRIFESIGGSQTSKITKNHVPSHAHESKSKSEFIAKTNAPYGTEVRAVAAQKYSNQSAVNHHIAKTHKETASWGDGKSFGNLPPFVALHFCIKKP